MDRMNRLRRSMLMVALMGAAFPAAVFAAPSALGEQLAVKGSSAGAPPCASCHGAAGQGQTAAGFPRLAGMSADYLSRQLMAFATGSRANPVMGPVAKMLTPVEQQSVARYYAVLAPVAQATDAPQRPGSVDGRLLVEKGDWNHGLPACSQCHGPAGLGVGSSFPQLAGQPSTYLANQLNSWKLGTRTNDPLGLMQGIAKKLSDSQVIAVADFYSGLPVAATSTPKAKP